MRRRTLAIVLTATALASVVVIAAAESPKKPHGKPIGCSMRSLGAFKGALDRQRNIVVGPLVFVGAQDAADEDPATIRRLGNWWKSAALVRQGHTVTVALARGAHGRAGLLYRQQRRTVPAADRAVTFKACHRTVRNDSVADGRRVTFWSGGFIASSIPACIPLEVWVDRERTPRRLTVSLAAGTCRSR